MHSRDRMDRLIAGAVRSGFQVRQTITGAWHFRRGITTLIFYRTPVNPDEWLVMIGALRGAGMVWPDVDPDAPTDL